MGGNGVVNGEVTVARLQLDRIVKRFDLMAYFYPYRHDDVNKDRSGWLRLIEVVHGDREGNLITLDLTFRQVREMLKRLGFQKLQRTAEDRKKRVHRWTNVSSQARKEYDQKHLEELLRQKAQDDNIRAQREECFG